ncbi:MAG: hypothetical protein NZM94_03280 [Roseiflexus sp.]|nr:hypothetical protein [Roseiflexus sp.]
MNREITYLNTDLKLTSTDDLTTLASALESGGVSPLYITQGKDGVWFANFETDEQYHEPEPNIAAMLAVIEALEPSLQLVWQSCLQREFDIGYECGTRPWGFKQGLSAEVLWRIAAVGASLRITLYPADQRDAPGPASCQISDTK